MEINPVEIKLTSKWVNCNENLLSTFYDNLKEILAFTDKPLNFSDKEYLSLLERYLEKEKTLKKLLEFDESSDAAMNQKIFQSNVSEFKSCN